MSSDTIGRRRRGLLAAFTLTAFLATPAFAVSTVDFEDVGAGLAPESAFRGEDGLGGFSSGGVGFVNSYTDFGSFDVWSGWAYSNETNTTIQSFSEDTSAYTGSGFGGSDTYGVSFAFDPSEVVFSGATSVLGAYLTNTTYTALTMLNGDAFTDAFAADDFLKVTITGLFGAIATGSVDFYLADYRNGMSLIVDTWAWVDLSGLGPVTSLQFQISGSDNDPTFGLNTPAYFAMDALTIQPIPEPGTALMMGLGLVLFAARREDGR